MSKQPFNYSEHREILQSLHQRFRAGDISEEEYRRGLARQGFNATEIEAEILARRMEDF